MSSPSKHGLYAHSSRKRYRSLLSTLKRVSDEDIDACLSPPFPQLVPFYHPDPTDKHPPSDTPHKPNLESLSLIVRHADGRVYIWRTADSDGKPTAIVEPATNDTAQVTPLAVPLALELVRAWDKKYTMAQRRAEMLHAATRAAWKVARSQAIFPAAEKLVEAFEANKDKSYEQLNVAGKWQPTPAYGSREMLSSSVDAFLHSVLGGRSPDQPALSLAGDPKFPGRATMPQSRLPQIDVEMRELPVTRTLSDLEIGLSARGKPVVRMPTPPASMWASPPQKQSNASALVTSGRTKRPVAADSFDEDDKQPVKRLCLLGPERPTDLVGQAIFDAITKVQGHHKEQVAGLAGAVQHLLSLMEPIGSDFDCVNDAVSNLRKELVGFNMLGP